MKRTLALILAFTLLLGSCVFLQGCGDNNSIIGKWKLTAEYVTKYNEWLRMFESKEKSKKSIDKDGIIEFFDDGSCNVTLYICNHYEAINKNGASKKKYSYYELNKNGRISFNNTSPLGGKDYKYKISDDQLIIFLEDEYAVYDTIKYDRV